MPKLEVIEGSRSQERRAAALAQEKSRVVPVVLRRRQVVAYGYIGSEAALDRARKEDPSFPKAIRLGPHAIGFRKADLDAWLTTRELVS